MERGVRRVRPSAKTRGVPIADGGDGTVEVLTRALGGRLVGTWVLGPLSKPVFARWGIVPRRRLAVIETAAACGVALVPPRRRNPFQTTTYGAGRLIRAALDRGCREIIVGLGGSATVDAGLGLLQALGAKIHTSAGLLSRPATGGDLTRLRGIDASGLNPRLRKAVILAACDVTNPLYGRRGAAFVYGPQKGANPSQTRMLDEGLRRFARLARRHFGMSVAQRPGAGAAGGLGAAMAAYLGARLESGAELIFSSVQMERHVRWADLILTGEGNADGQSADGKAASLLARLARRHGKRLVVLAGAVKPGAERLLGLGAEAVIGVSDSRKSERENFRNVRRNIATATARTLFSQGFG